MGQRRVIIVGAGPAGARCAERLAGAALVTLIGAEPAHPYNRVALSNYLAGKITEPDLFTHPPAHLAATNIIWRPDTRVDTIDRAARHVTLHTGERLPYDALVLATGAQAVRIPLPGADLPHVLLYRTLADVRAMLDHATRGGPAVVIGGGLLGLEAAAGLAYRGMQPTVLQAAPWLMNRQLDEGAATLLLNRLAAQGITTILDAKTAAIKPGAVILADGTTIPARIVVMAAGIRPETTLARSAALPINRGILVDDAMRTADPAIYAIGECSEHAGQTVGLVAPSYAQAETAAAAIRGEPARYVPVQDSAALKIAGAGVWSAGEIEGDDPITLDDPEAGQYRRFLIRNDRLVGAVLYGDTTDAPWYFDLIKQARPLGAARLSLPFGPAFMPPAPTLEDLAA